MHISYYSHFLSSLALFLVDTLKVCIASYNYLKPIKPEQLVLDM